MMKRQRLYRGKRAELAWGLLGFAALQAALAVGVERCWPGVRDPEFAGKQARLAERRAEAAERPLVLALGSSRTLMGLQAERLSRGEALVFNFGVPGGGPMMEQVCLRRLLAAGLRPDLVVIEVMPVYFSERGGCPLEEKGLDPARLQGPELLRLARYYDRLDRLSLRWCGARLLPCYRHQAELRDALGLDAPAPGHEDAGPNAGMDPYGWQPHFVAVTPEQREEKTRFALAQYGGPLAAGPTALIRTPNGPVADAAADYRLAPRQARALRDLLGLCRREKIAAALVLMPEGKRFRALTPGETLRPLEAFLAGLSRHYRAPLIDARTWIDDDGFWDAHHLLPAGAEAFTARFESEALRPLLAR